MTRRPLPTCESAGGAGAGQSSWLTCAPVTVIALVCLLVWVVGSRFQNVFGVQVAIDSATSRRDALLVTGGLVVAVAATAVVLREARLTVRGLRRALGTVLALDLVVLNVLLVAIPTSQDLATAKGVAARQFTALVGNARFAIYDPDTFDDGELLALGQTDLNAYNDLGSGQGYTALTDGTYASVTGAHYQEDLAPAVVGRQLVGRPRRGHPSVVAGLLHDPAAARWVNPDRGLLSDSGPSLQRVPRRGDRTGFPSSWNVPSLVLRENSDPPVSAVHRLARGGREERLVPPSALSDPGARCRGSTRRATRPTMGPRPDL